MEHPILLIKEAVIKKLRTLDPDIDVFCEEIKETGQGLNQSRTWYYLDLIPGSHETVDGLFTDMNILVDISYHTKTESNTDYLIKGSQLDSAMRPVLRFGDRAITIHSAESKVVDHVLHYRFSLQFRHSFAQIKENDRMGELEIGVKKEDV